MRDYPQHEDLGLVDDDNTEDLRKENAPGAAPTVTGGNEPNQSAERKKFMNTIPTPCRHCTIPLDTGDVCPGCRHYDADPTKYSVDSSIPDRGQLDDDETVTALASVHNGATAVGLEVQHLLGILPADVPLWSVVDLVGARQHLAAAAKLIDRAAQRITADE